METNYNINELTPAQAQQVVNDLLKEKETLQAKISNEKKLSEVRESKGVTMSKKDFAKIFTAFKKMFSGINTMLEVEALTEQQQEDLLELITGTYSLLGYEVSEDTENEQIDLSEDLKNDVSVDNDDEITETVEETVEIVEDFEKNDEVNATIKDDVVDDPKEKLVQEDLLGDISVDVDEIDGEDIDF